MQNPAQHDTAKKRRKTSRPSQLPPDTTNNLVHITASHTSDSLGNCTLVYEQNAYETKMLLKSVSYTVPEPTLRASIVEFS